MKPTHSYWIDEKLLYLCLSLTIIFQQGGVFKLGKHEFTLEPSLSNKRKIKVTKRSTEPKMDFSRDGGKYNIEFNSICTG